MSLVTRALEALNWKLVQENLAARTRSPLGGALALRHLPFESPGESHRLRTRVLEACLLVQRSPLHGYLNGTEDPSAFFDRAARDGVLKPAELWACGQFLGTLGITGNELREKAEVAPNLSADFEKAPGTPPVCAVIQRSVSSAGDILDTASHDLARLRRERVERRADFERTLTSKVKEWSQSGLLQDDFYDVMDGRYVVPVKVEQQSKLGGVLYGKSNTGQSVFIEPAELTSANNELKETDLAIRAEEFRILKALSAQIGALAPVATEWIAPLAELDLVLAAATLAKDWELAAPTIRGNDSELQLKDVFHPGLKVRGVDIVKNSLTLPARATEGGFALLISGPNTGGKTVLLKATAVAACMANAGLLVPAEKESVFPHYGRILAFIGDEQDLSTGLSSFSAQILEMKAVLELGDGSAPFLIVIDEMLSSTDPEEASALAQALIEEFVARGHHVVVTSHFSELSLRCRQHPRIAVAAMEFDGNKPTYRLRPDELGSSHALDIARRLGIPARILDRALKLMSTAKLDYERAIESLRAKESKLEAERLEEQKQFEREKRTISKDFETRLARFVDDAARKVDETIAALNRRIETYVRQGIAPKKSAQLEADARHAVRELETAAARETGKSDAAASAAPVVKGSLVKLPSMPGTRATVLEVHDARRTATIQVGNFRMEKPLDDLIVVEPPKTLSRSSYVGTDIPERVASKLDLRGKRYDEALGEAERFIDQAFRGGAASITIVTGHGTGALKKGLKELLKSLPYVKDAHPERTNDDGATVIEFDR